MKVLGRIVIIVAAALMVVGATVVFANSGAAASVVGSPGRGAGVERQAPEAAAGQAPPADRGRPERGADGGRGGGGWLAGLAEVGRTVGVMAVIIAGVVLAQRGGRRLRSATRPRTAPPPSKRSA